MQKVVGWLKSSVPLVVVLGVMWITGVVVIHIRPRTTTSGTDDLITHNILYILLSFLFPYLMPAYSSCHYKEANVEA